MYSRWFLSAALILLAIGPARAWAPCQLPDAATITPSTAGCADDPYSQAYIYTATPSTTRTLKFPTGSGIVAGREIYFMVNQPSSGGPGALNLGLGWRLMASTLTNGQPQWSKTPGAQDGLDCIVLPSTAPDAQKGLIMYCPAGVLLNTVAAQ